MMYDSDDMSDGEASDCYTISAAGSEDDIEDDSDDSDAPITGNTDLLIAAARGETGAVAMILRNPETIVDFQNSLGFSALGWACPRGHVAIAEMLLDAGANIEIIDYTGGTPLISACSEMQLDVMTLLLERGANVSATNIRGETVICRAIDDGSVDAGIGVDGLLRFEMAKRLIEHGVDVHRISSSGESAVECAIRVGNVALVAFLRRA